MTNDRDFYWSPSACWAAETAENEIEINIVINIQHKMFSSHQHTVPTGRSCWLWTNLKIYTVIVLQIHTPFQGSVHM